MILINPAGTLPRGSKNKKNTRQVYNTPIQTMEESEPYEAGTLCAQNIERAAEQIFRLLNGKSFTVIVSREHNGFKPEAVTGRRLALGERFSVLSGPGHARRFSFSDTKDTFILSTGQFDAGFDREFDNPYLEFKGRQVIITVRAPMGQKLYWAFVLEPEPEQA